PKGDEVTIDEIVRQAVSYEAWHAVVTGGEPMIAPGVGELTEKLKAAGMHITIETAGTVCSQGAVDFMSIRPKLANWTPGGQWAAQHERLRYQPEVLKNLMRDYEYQLKFVVARPEDLEEIGKMLEEIAADRNRVALMAEGTEAAAIAERAAWLVEI